MVATTGMAALPAVLAALRSGRRVALANKETLVTGGHLVTAVLDELGGDPLDRLRPIDSEHSAIWQCLVGERLSEVERLVLTASGGPFRGRAPETLGGVTADEALAHPTWRMGPKITIDSATLVNKAFEVIEAKWLYRLPYSKIEAVIHPQSVVHSLVEFVDGSYKAQLGLPDMRLPIQYALTYPSRLPSPAQRSAPEGWEPLSFQPLATGAYPAYDTVRAGGRCGRQPRHHPQRRRRGGGRCLPRWAHPLPGDRGDHRRRGRALGRGPRARPRGGRRPRRRGARDADGGAPLMEVLGTVAAFIGILVVLVLVHELGHFIVAKRAGITVEEFGIGFPPRISSVMYRGTRYSLNWIPLGGFVKMLGEDGDVEIRRLRESGLSDDEVEQAMAGAFNRRPVWVRVGVLLAGVVMNFVLAAALFAVAFSMPTLVGEGPLTVTEIQAGSPAEGTLEVGDVIVGVDGRTFQRSADLTDFVAERGGTPVTLDVERDGQSIEVEVVPRVVTEEDRAAGVGPDRIRL